MERWTAFTRMWLRSRHRLAFALTMYCTSATSVYGPIRTGSTRRRATMRGRATFRCGSERIGGCRGRPFFFKGNHEDFVWLDALQDAEVLPGLTYLRNG